MKFKNIKVYGLSESIYRSGYPNRIGEPADLDGLELSDSSYDRAKRLSSVKTGTGHDTFLRGIIVQMDIRYPEFFSPQLQRYKFVDIISSQSKMYSLMKRPIEQDDFYDDIHPGTIAILNIFISNGEFDKAINSLPSGYMKWMGISTNFLALKTIYWQRKNHKLQCWRDFCKMIEELPMSYLITKKI